MSEIEATIRAAAEQCRRLIVRYQGASGGQYERELEPYVLGDTELVAFEYFEDRFRSYPLARILSAELTPRTFQPRRPILVGASDPRHAPRSAADGRG